MSMNINSDQYEAQPMRVYGLLDGHLPRLIAIVYSDIKAEAIHREWKALSFAEKCKWVSNPKLTGFKPLLLVFNHTTVTVSPSVIASVPAVILVGYLLVFGGGA